MKITSVECVCLEAPVATPWRHGTATMTSARANLVRVRTDTGLVGTGECMVRLAPGATRQIVRELLAPLLVGADPMEIEGLWERMHETMRARGHSTGFMLEAIAGVDMALWDVAAQALGQPVWRLMLGAGRRELPCYASSIFIISPEESAQEAAALVARGYRAMKIKIGRGPQMDEAVVKAVRQAVGDGVEIMVDANGAYDAGTALRVGQRLAPLGVAWFEEPVPADDLNGYVHLRRHLAMPIAGGEAAFSTFEIRNLLVAGGLDVVQPDVARAGGITGNRRIAAVAAAFNIPLAPHTGVCSGVAQIAALHLAAAAPSFKIYEDMYVENPLKELFVEPFPRMAGGVVPVPAGPGWGLRVNEELVERYTRE